MTPSEITDGELSAFLDEALPPQRSADIEHRLRSDAELRRRLQEVSGRSAAGLHTVGGIWRRGRLSCPDRSELGQMLLGTMDPEEADYIKFHIDTVGCRYCAANLADLESASTRADQPSARRKRYFQTSVGHLRET